MSFQKEKFKYVEYGFSLCKNTILTRLKYEMQIVIQIYVYTKQVRGMNTWHIRQILLYT